MALTLVKPTTAPTFTLACFDRTDNVHEIRTNSIDHTDAAGEPLETCSQAYKDSREAHPVGEWTRLAGGSDPAPSLAREVLLANNANAERYRLSAARTGCNAILAWTLHKKWDKAHGQENKEDIADAICAVLQCKRPLLHPPQEVEPSLKRPEYGNPRAFLVTNLSKEHHDELTLSTYYCVRLGPDRVVSFGVAAWDLMPCRYLATLRDVDSMDFSSQTAKDIVYQGLREHVGRREAAIHQFVGSNRAHWWGGDNVITSREFVRERLIPQLVIKALTQPAQPEVQREAMHRFVVFAPGVFNEDRNNLREGWRQAVLGPSNGKIDLFFGDATIANKDWFCTYCLQISHMHRLCPIMHHPTWFDGAREELEQEDRKLADAYRATAGERTKREADELARRVASRGGRSSRGARGSGRGGPRPPRGGGRGGRGHQLSLSYGQA